jgi:hypothetical protein
MEMSERAMELARASCGRLHSRAFVLLCFALLCFALLCFASVLVGRSSVLLFLPVAFVLSVMTRACIDLDLKCGSMSM